MKGRHPWDKVSKLNMLVFKAGSRVNIKWVVLECIDDMLNRQALGAEDVSGRALKGHEQAPSLVTLLLAKTVAR